MKKGTNLTTVAVVGGGISGLMSAWFLAKAGCAVTLFEKEKCGSGTTQYAAGMLAPISELEFSELSLLQAGLASRTLYDALEQELGDIGLIRHGTLEVGLQQEDEGFLKRSFAFQRELGLPVQWVDSNQIRKLEPFVSPNVPFGIHSPEDIQIDHFKLIQLLLERLPSLGVEIREQDTLIRIDQCLGGMLNLISTHTERAFHKIVMAVGAFGGPEIALPFEIYPIRGEVISLTPPPHDYLKYTIRIRSRALGNAYVVPKSDCIIVGTTLEEKGYSQVNTYGGLLNIMRKCYAAVPSLFDLDVLEIGAGLRPASINRLPIVDKEPMKEIYHVNGLFRHGILLAPLIGKSVTELLITGLRDPIIESFRF